MILSAVLILPVFFLIPAEYIKHKCLSTVLFFFLLFSFFNFSFFYLKKCLSRRTEACNKVHLLIYYWWNRILSVSLFLFWIHITSQYLGRVEENNLSYTYLWRGLMSVPFSLFLRPSDIPGIGWISVFFCWFLSKE